MPPEPLQGTFVCGAFGGDDPSGLRPPPLGRGGVEERSLGRLGMTRRYLEVTETHRQGPKRRGRFEGKGTFVCQGFGTWNSAANQIGANQKRLPEIEQTFLNTTLIFTLLAIIPQDCMNGRRHCNRWYRCQLQWSYYLQNLSIICSWDSLKAQSWGLSRLHTSPPHFQQI